MTTPNNGKLDTKIHDLKSIRHTLRTCSHWNGKTISLVIALGLTVWLGVMKEYLYALAALVVALCAATADRLIKLRFSIWDIRLEWSDPRERYRSRGDTPRRGN